MKVKKYSHNNEHGKLEKARNKSRRKTNMLTRDHFKASIGAGQKVHSGFLYVHGNSNELFGQSE